MTGLTDEEVEQYARRLGLPLVGIFLRDKLPAKTVDNGFYVFNLDTSRGDGTHWTGAITKHGEVNYFDSFGFPPPTEIVKFLKGKQNRQIGWNNWALQPITSTTCGLWVITYGAYVHGADVGSLQQTANTFLNHFGSDFLKNDRRMKAEFKMLFDSA